MLELFGIRYAQDKGGQKLHIVADFGNAVSTEALCGKKVNRWRKTFNVPLAHCCKNCMRVDRLNGRDRMRQIVSDVLRAEGY